MCQDFQEIDVSIALVLCDNLPYDRAAFAECLSAALGQDHPPVELIAVGGRGPSAALDFVDKGMLGVGLVRHLRDDYRNWASMYNAA